jgi:hypothetical protein
MGPIQRKSRPSATRRARPQRKSAGVVYRLEADFYSDTALSALCQEQRSK